MNRNVRGSREGPPYTGKEMATRTVSAHIYLRKVFQGLRNSAIKGNEIKSVLMRWMNKKPIIQSEVSQKEKNKYSIDRKSVV